MAPDNYAANSLALSKNGKLLCLNISYFRRYKSILHNSVWKMMEFLPVGDSNSLICKMRPRWDTAYTVYASIYFVVHCSLECHRRCAFSEHRNLRFPFVMC